MAQVESDVVFGMYSGLALLLDVHHPDRSNGYGVVYIPGSGWHTAQGYDAVPLKERPPVASTIGPLRDAGYTVFVVNHRAAPQFRYPAAVQDAQRAVRWIRHNANAYNIRAGHIGAMGSSSGGHLVNMLGVLAGQGDPDAQDPVERERSSVQCVVAFYAPSDFLSLQAEPLSARDAVSSFLGMRLIPGSTPSSIEYKTYREASPVAHVSKACPPFLLIHGDADTTVPFGQSKTLEQALMNEGVEVKLIRVEGGGHGAGFPGATNLPDYLGESVRWFDHYLQHSPVGFHSISAEAATHAASTSTTLSQPSER